MNDHPSGNFSQPSIGSNTTLPLPSLMAMERLLSTRTFAGQPDLDPLTQPWSIRVSGQTAGAPAPPLEASPAGRGGRAPECADDLFTANGGRVEFDVPGPQSVHHGIRDRHRWRNRAPLSESFDPEWIHGRRDLLMLDFEARKLRCGRYGVIHQRRRQELAVLIVGQVFPKSRTDALGGAGARGNEHEGPLYRAAVCATTSSSQGPGKRPRFTRSWSKSRSWRGHWLRGNSYETSTPLPSG